MPKHSVRSPSELAVWRPRPGRRLLASLLVLLAGCGATPRASSEATRPAPRACPLARDVRRAEWMAPDPTEVAQGLRRGWAIPVGHRPLAEGDGASGRLDRAAAEALGVAIVPDAVWVLRADQPACLAHVDGYEARVVEDGVRNLRLSAFTADCPGERDAWVSFTDPGACQLSIATELGALRLNADDSMPAERAPLPDVYASSVPPSECEGACDVQLWQVRVARGRPDVAEVWVTSIAVDPSSSPCDWESASHVALHVSDAAGVMRALDWPFVEDRGYRVPRTLDAILVDEAGTRVVLLTDHAASAAYELGADGTFGEGVSVEHYIPHEEDGVVRSLAPYCGP